MVLEELNVIAVINFMANIELFFPNKLELNSKEKLKKNCENGLKVGPLITNQKNKGSSPFSRSKR